MATRNKAVIGTGLAIAAGLFVAPSRAAHAVEAQTPPSPSVPCAVLEKFGGETQLLDVSRTQLIDTRPRAPIQCGSWISVSSGWALVRHRSGFLVHVGAGTFAQFPESDLDGRNRGDQVILFKGQVYGIAGDGSGELRIQTANARARMTRGTSLVIYSQADEESQLLVIDGTATLENRFQTTRQVKVHPGEATALNFRALRVVPSTPRAVSVASLKQKLEYLHLDERDEAKAIRSARERQERKFASTLLSQEEAKSGHEPSSLEEEEAVVLGAPGRSPASAPSASSRVTSYVRHSPRKEEDAKLRERWVKRMVAGQAVGERILFPDKYYGRQQEVKVIVEDPLASERKRQTKEEQMEKARLIEELSNIRSD